MVMVVLGVVIGVQYLFQVVFGEVFVGGIGGWCYVIVVVYVQIGVWIGDVDQVVECIVVIGGGDVVCIGGGFVVVGGVYGEVVGVIVWVDLVGQIIEIVVGVGGMQIFWVSDLCDLVQCVVLVVDFGGYVIYVLQGLGQVVQWIVLLVGYVLQGVGYCLWVVVGIVGKVGSVIVCVFQCGQLVECVECLC